MPKLPKRKRLFTPSKNRLKLSASKPEKAENLHKQKLYTPFQDTVKEYNEVDTARGRLKGALMDVLEPRSEESDTSSEAATPVKTTTRKSSAEEYLSDEEAKKRLRKSPAKQSYVLKLFDRSVDLSQFREDSPLYPICRAWIANQPKADYNVGRNTKEPESEENGVELPGPEGPPVSRVPDLVDKQKEANKDNINLNYREAPPPPKEQLLRQHAARWAAVRQAWLDQASKVEARYKATQKVLYKINIEYLNNHS